MASMEQRVQETTLTNVNIVSCAEAVTLIPPQQQINNNNKFHAVNHQTIKRRFPKKLAVDIQFSDIYYRATVWSLQQPKPGE
jgi:hypothetical protein